MRQRIGLIASVLLLAVLVLVAVMACSFLGEVLASRQIAFRDAGHFYYPLHQVLKTHGLGVFADDAANADNVWREPIVANPTSGVFYPITWILLLAFPTPFDEHLIILVHLIIAAVTTRRLARSLRVSPLAATFAGFVYAASGGVLFQMHNIIFLVGAAWLPEAVRLILSLRQRHRLRDAGWLSVVVSLMIFGGDVQAAFHLALFGLVLLVCDFMLLLDSGGGRYRPLLHFFALLAAAVFLVVLVTSVQWIPTINAVLKSDRFSEDHAASANHFRVPIFQFVEFVYPHFSGMPHPQNTRWTLAAELDGIWVQSLYAGVIPAVMVILSLRLWGSARLVALTWCLLIACVVAMGRDFGVYALIEMIPGYGLFRYPGKWITVASLPFSLLAAIGFDTVISAKEHRHRFLIAALAIAACVFFVMQIVLWSGAMEANITPHPGIGPFQREMALQQFITGGVWGIGVLLIAAILARFILPLGFILVALTVLDVLAINAPLAVTVSRSAFDISHAEPLRRLIAENMPSNVTRPPRLFRIVCEPPEWRETTSPTRLDEWIARDIVTLAPRCHWLLPPAERIDVLPDNWTFISCEITSRLHWTEYGLWIPDDWQSVTQLGIDFFLVSDTIALPDAWLQHLEQVSSDKYKLPPGITLWRVRDAAAAPPP